MNKKESPDWLRLQRKIFSRWCNQKLSLSRNMPVEDIVDEIGDGIKLINLIEVLSEVDYTEKYNKTPKMKVHKIDNCNRALKFVKQQGVEMKTPPSAENLVDGDELNILGLIWAIMSKYMKFGDDDESLNAKEALLLWVQNKTAGYDDVAVKDFKSSIKDGVAMGAVIHKHRPNMIDMSKLTKGKDNAVANWAVVQDAALKYFDLEKYITPEDILKLDENSMVVYVSEYYTGIAEQRKVDLAARRITKLIRFTEENDKLRAEYVVKAKSFTDTVAKVQVILNDRTIDNTMAGAKAKIEQFYEYKATDKSSILGDQLALEGLFNSLAMRLSHGKRPAYVPPEGTDLDAMNATVGQLEKTEQERKVALHQELNRQIKLLDFDKQHKAASAQLVEYQTTTEADLSKKEVSHSVAAASYQLRHLDALDRERKSIVSTTFAKLLKLGATLKDEKYERSNEVADREQQLTSTFDRLEKLSSEKRPVLDDDLAREIFREDLRLKNEQHVQKHAKIEQWVAEQTAYLEKKEEIDSVGDATLQLGLLSAYASEKEAQSQAAVASFKALGAEVLAAKYDNGLSTYELGDEPDTANKDQLRARETAVDEHWQRLDGLYNDKKAVLEDDLARETFRDNLKLQDNMHRRSHAALTSWASEGASYLAQREDIDDIPKANTQLSILKAWRGDFAAQQSNALPALKTLGKSILDAKYETSLSSYTFGSAQSDTQTPEQLKEREQKIDETFVNLDGAAGEKQSWLEAELAREQAKEENRVQFANQAAAFARLASETDNEAKSTHFGFTLAEVEAFGADLQADDQQREKATDEQHAAAVETFAEGEKLGVKSNAYTEATPASLTTLHEQTKKALADRRERYEKELAHQRYLDGLARDFAALADPFSESMVSTKNQISSSQNSLEEQLAFVAARVAESEAGDQPKLEAILAAQKKLDDEGVTNNIHTTLTGKDVETQHQQFVLFLNAKKKMLEEAIEQAKLRGLTESDFKEIKENFEQFDKDGDKSISQKELKACLFSLGEEKGPKEVEAIMQEFGENGELSEERFTEFMIKTLGDADTKDEILAGFKLINRGEDQKTTVDRMENVLESHEVEYLKENATPIDDGYDYVAWTEDVYSR